MYGCDLLYSPEVAAKVRAELRRVMGSCPCDLDQKCPLLPADVTKLLPRRASV
jgi:hypothetical protein